MGINVSGALNDCQVAVEECKENLSVKTSGHSNLCRLHTIILVLSKAKTLSVTFELDSDFEVLLKIDVNYDIDCVICFPRSTTPQSSEFTQSQMLQLIH